VSDDATAAASIMDVVFLLLIYFAVAYETPDSLAALPLSLPNDEVVLPVRPPHTNVHRDGDTMERETETSIARTTACITRCRRASRQFY
jgi:hypothetical protein